MTSATTAKTAKTRAPSKAQQELETLRLHFDANVADAVTKAVADATAPLVTKIAELEERLALARESFVKLRTAAREAIAEVRAENAVLVAARPAPRPLTPAQAAYAAGAADRARIAQEFAKRRAELKVRSAAYFAAHPSAKSAADAQINAWYEQSAPVDCE